MSYNAVYIQVGLNLVTTIALYLTILQKHKSSALKSRMFSGKFVLFVLSMLYAASHPSKAQGMGYLFLNTSNKPLCYDLSPNDICPQSLVNYQILVFNKTSENVPKMELESVKLALRSLDFLQVSQPCRDSVQEYSCSNIFAVCTTGEHGVQVKYNYEKTKAACARVQSICPKTVTEKIVYNCSLIQKDVSGYTYCKELPAVPDDICPKSSYTVSVVYI